MVYGIFILKTKKGIFLFECQKSLHLPLTRLIWFDNLTLL
ncbi:hypothetical protein Lpp226_1865 [Lacticaseibacillus paracasei subsp. paracasei Lpp226]|nr:hypothetical protein Lpp226_1865 [Lacticaseibacillus paracasei subsp. paracasei Lpp226]